MTTSQLIGASALVLALGLSTGAFAKPDYLDRMTPRAKPEARVASCDCPMMRTGGGQASVCMAPTDPAPKGTPKGV